MGKGNTVDVKLVAEKIHLEWLMDEVVPEGILSYVADSYDFWGVVTEVLPRLKDKIMQRNGRVVIRPDSGDPVKILTGYNVFPVKSVQDFFNRGACEYLDFDPQYHEVLFDGDNYTLLNTAFNKDGTIQGYNFNGIAEYEVKGLVEFLYDVFGGTETETGHKLLDEHIGCIYGDSITLERQDQILSRLAAKGFCSGNVVLGIGSFTYQYVTRDTHGSAVKATSIVTEDEGRIAIAKDPKTGDGSKKSAKGLLHVGYTESDGYFLTDNVEEWLEQDASNNLELVWKDGEWFREQTLEEIREIVKSN